jgi:hypothetical protein
VWEPARWANESGAWVFYEGQWRAGPPPSVVYAPPPAPRHFDRRDHRHDRGWRHD